MAVQGITEGPFVAKHGIYAHARLNAFHIITVVGNSTDGSNAIPVAGTVSEAEGISREFRLETPGPKFTYIGKEARVFKVTMDFTVQDGVGSVVFSSYICLNGTAPNASGMRWRSLLVNVEHLGSNTRIMVLNPGDVVEAAFENQENGADIVVRNLYMNISSVD